MILRHTVRLAAVALLVASVSLVGLSATPAGAANTNVTADCTGTASPQTIGNSDTVTFTLGSGCGAVIFMSGTGTAGTAAVATPFQQTLTIGAPFGGLSPGDTVVFTAPASGSGSMQIGFMANAQSPPAITFTISYPAPTPRSDSMTDNGNGSMTVTYSSVTPQQSVFVSFFPPGTTCDPTASQSSWASRLYVVSSSSNSAPIGLSPTVITAGTNGLSGTPPNTTVSAIAAGSYQTCLYFFNGQTSTLSQSLAVTLGSVAPTTTTTAAAADPVPPVFAG